MHGPHHWQSEGRQHALHRIPQCWQRQHSQGPDNQTLIWWSQSTIWTAQGLLRPNNWRTSSRKLQSLQIPTVWADRESHAVPDKKRSRIQASAAWTGILECSLKEGDHIENDDSQQDILSILNPDSPLNHPNKLIKTSLIKFVIILKL